MNPHRAAVLIVAAVAMLVGAGYLAVRGDRAQSLGRWMPVTRPAGPITSSAGPAAGPPDRLRVPSIGVDAGLENLRLDPSGVLGPPEDFARPGWYADGTAPGDTGPAVIAGHIDSRRGPAVFFRLRELAVGDQIEVVRGGATVTFTVAGAAWYPKDGFPTARVYGPTPDPQLRLITCGGGFDRSRRSYRDNLVVYAVAG